jgi:diacylglycerol O-acyltransferase
MSTSWECDLRQLSGLDASFLYVETAHAHLHLTSVAILDRSAISTPFEFTDIRRFIESRLHAWPGYRQKIVSVPLQLDYPYWIDDPDFDAESHFEHLGLPAPGNWQQFCDVVAQVHSKPLDFERPPWDMHIVDGLGDIDGIPNDSFALISRYHHAALDGASGTAILRSLYSLTPEHDPEPTIPDWEPEPGPSLTTMINRAVASNVVLPLRFAKVLGGTLPGFGKTILKRAIGATQPPADVPDTRFNAAVSPERVVDAVSFPLREVAGIRSAVPGSTVNDVLLAICGGALRLYLEDKEELPDESLVAIVPINTRTAAESETEGNVIATMFIPLRSDIDDPLERLEAIRDATRAAKTAKEPISPRQLTELSQNVPASSGAIGGWLMTTLGLGYRGMRFANCTVSNVPGPQQPLYLNGAKTLRMMGVGPVIDGLGLMFTALSYDGTVVLSISGAQNMTPDPEVLADCLRMAMATLLDATDAGSPGTTLD